MPSNPKVKALAREAAIKIKGLTVAHQTQIEAIYQEFREQVANIQKDNADELETPSATPVPQSSKVTKESHDFTP
jgi:tRNA(Met) C34 N-acetyltransferase TmcA